jgi:hypothetical protein
LIQLPLWELMSATGPIFRGFWTQVGPKSSARTFPAGPEESHALHLLS